MISEGRFNLLTL